MGQLKGKKGDIIGVLNNKEVEKYVCRLYMYEGIMHMTLSVKKPCTHVCTYIEDINRGAQNMFNREAIYANVIKIELVKWTRPQTRQRITTIMDQAIKQGFPKD